MTNGQRFAHLDLMRAIAAWLVLASHLRSFVFVDWPMVSDPQPWHALFYFATGLGHQAVMVFFVLSGFFVGGSVARDYRRGTWSVGGYAVKRLVRLETVLVPALLATLVWDRAGAFLSGGLGYDGRWAALINSGPSLASPASHTPALFMGNLAFLTGIVVPAFGTNAPLWSLADEFWYYVIFPCLWASIYLAGPRRLVALVALALAVLGLPGQVLIYGLVWLLGFVASEAFERPSFARLRISAAALAASGLLLLGALWVSKTLPGFPGDVLVGVASMLAALVLGLRSRTVTPGGYSRACAWLADSSYSLYLFHFPLLCFIAYAFLLPERLQPGGLAYGRYAVIAAVTLAYAAAAWWCFERNTTRIRRLLAPRHIRKRQPIQHACGD